MIVLLDANALIKDPYCHSLPWKILAGQADTWDLDLRVPWISFHEAVGTLQRRLAEDAAALDELVERYGLHSSIGQARSDLLDWHERLPDDLTKALERRGVTFVDPAPVPHLEVVQRQVQRRRPCKAETGDGYRDTLNWLTVLDTAAGNPGRTVVWVSEDGDFSDGTAKATRLHPDLIEDAKEKGVDGRVFLHKHLGSVAQVLTRKKGLPRNLEEAHRHLLIETIRGYVTRDVLPQLVGPAADRHTYTVASCTPIGDTEVKEQGLAPNVGTVWEFTAPVRLTVEEVPGLPPRRDRDWTGHHGRCRPADRRRDQRGRPSAAFSAGV